MSNDRQPVSVTILDREFQFASTPDELAALKEAAELLDGKMRDVKTSANLLAFERIAVMTALNMADELLRLKKAGVQREETVDRRIRMLADELDNALGEPLD